MNGFYLSMMCLAIPYVLSAMDTKSLNAIERTLVFNEINRRGLSYVKRIDQKTPKNDFLHIKDIFFKNDMEKDPLTRAIFNAITSIEEINGGYRPIRTDIPNAHVFSARSWRREPTNFLGHHTRYYWEYENNVIRIEAKITNRRELKQLIDQEETRLSNVLRSKSMVN